MSVSSLAERSVEYLSVFDLFLRSHEFTES
jgi:hypothetical protein